MPIDAPVIANLVKEIGGLLPVKVDKIYQPFPEEILFSCFGSGVSCKILISLHPQFFRLSLFEGERDNPYQPSAFGMLLRKHFSGAKLIKIDTIPFERICCLTFETYDQFQGLCQKLIWVELTGKSSNLIIASKDNLIIDVWRKTGSPLPDGRELTAGAKYEPPETGGRWKPVTIAREQFSNLITNIPAHIPLEKFLLKHWYGLSALAVHEITHQAGLKPHTTCGEISEINLQQLYNAFVTWSEAMTNQCFEPSALYNRQGFIVDGWAFAIQFPPEGYTIKKVESLNRIVNQIMEQNLKVSRYQLLKSSLEHRIKNLLEKAQGKLAKQQAEADAAEQGDSYRIAGELLTTYGSQIKKGSQEIKLPNHYDFQNGDLAIVLNPALTAQENAQVYFKKYQKAKKGRLAIAHQIGKTLETVAYLESVATLIQNAQNLLDLRLIQTELETETESRPSKRSAPKSKKEPPAEPRRFTTSEGDLILVGRNNLQNDHLTFKVAGPEDLWLHTQKIPGSHVIVKLKPGNALTETTLNFACQLAVYFSKARQSTKVPVDYTNRKYVKKPPASKAGFVIYDFFKTAIITPDPVLLRKLGLNDLPESHQSH